MPVHFNLVVLLVFSREFPVFMSSMLVAMRRDDPFLSVHRVITFLLVSVLGVEYVGSLHRSTDLSRRHTPSGNVGH